MERILEKFYRGKVIPSDFPPPSHEQAQKASDKYEQMYDALRSKLDEPTRKELMRLIDAHTETTVYDCVENFIQGYRLGALMMMEVLQGN